ncbi:sensor histidine kinase [Acidipropionibacterium jensenii]|uniref:sensor histidine kinase n=1 Tax=Acidipropionibacterium jensenii TaxID=1749 RepID=UPI000BC2F08D|nr:histidine kinase [Acidipropionibacterium jensenii]
MRRSAILWMLAGVLAVVTLILAAGGVLVASAFVRVPVAMLVGVLLTGAVGLVSVRLHHWAGRLIDPRAEIETELAGLGEVSGHRRMALQQVLRKVTGDPSLSLAVRADDTWLDADGNPISPPADAVPLGRAGGDALVICSRPELSGRIARVGDWGSLLDPAVMEAVVEQEAARADRAAAAERTRISRDLHDGVQAHLLGIALNLQLSGRGLEEPGARLLVEETVVGLRDAVSQVRALAEGGAPPVLVTDGLGAALAHLVRPLDVVTQTRLPERRHSAEVEETAFFVASEAIANAVKHAGADHIEIAVEETGSVLTVIVTDDGVGGADLRLGTGLRGITERVAAFGGLLVVREARPRGTVVEASLPCG